MRLAQNKVQVNVIGTDKLGWFETVDPSGYVLVHEQDLAQLLRNTKQLQELLKNTGP